MFDTNLPPGFRIPDVRDRPVDIYALVDPRDGVVKYVGKSSNLVSRVAGHCGDGATRPVMAWVNALGDLAPEVRVLRTVPPGGDCTFWERVFITKHRATVLNFDIPGERIERRKRTPSPIATVERPVGTLAAAVTAEVRRAVREAMTEEGGNAMRAARLLEISHRHICRLLDDPALADVPRAPGGRPRSNS